MIPSVVLKLNVNMVATHCSLYELKSTEWNDKILK